MKSVFFTPLIALGLGLAATTQAQVLMLDFGPTATTGSNLTNSPYHTVDTAFTGTTWNQIQTSDVTSGIKYADGSSAGVTVNVGASTSTTSLDLSGTPSGNSALGSVVSSGIYAGTSVGTDGIFNGSTNLTGTSVGVQIGGLAAGTYDIYISARNTSRASTSAYSQVIAAGGSSIAGSFDYSGYTQSTLSYPNTASPSGTSAWTAGTNYTVLTVTISSGDYLNIAVHGGGEDMRGFLNSVEIVNTSAIPEPTTYALLGGLAALVFVVARRWKQPAE